MASLFEFARSVLFFPLCDLIETSYDILSHIYLNSNGRYIHTYKSFIDNRNRIGPRIYPCGTPVLTIFLVEQEIPTLTNCLRFER